MKVDPIKKIMLTRSIELSGVNSPKAPTWRTSCRCSTTDSLPRGYPRQLFGLRRMLESTVNARDSRFILVQALDRDRVIALCPVGVSLCVRLIVILCTIVLSLLSLLLRLLTYQSRKPCPPLYSLGGKSPSWFTM